MESPTKNDLVVYLCDPKKNGKCMKTACQDLCFHTLHAEFSKDGKRYRYNVDKDEYENLDA